MFKPLKTGVTPPSGIIVINGGISTQALYWDHFIIKGLVSVLASCHFLACMKQKKLNIQVGNATVSQCQ